jgi:hypothetical protein
MAFENTNKLYITLYMDSNTLNTKEIKIKTKTKRPQELPIHTHISL